jgi:hypothetical protein
MYVAIRGAAVILCSAVMTMAAFAVVLLSAAILTSPVVPVRVFTDHDSGGHARHEVIAGTDKTGYVNVSGTGIVFVRGEWKVY